MKSKKLKKRDCNWDIKAIKTNAMSNKKQKMSAQKQV